MYDQQDKLFMITIRSIPSSTPAINRLRRLLKVLLRSFGYRVVRIEESTSGDQ